MNGVEQLYEKIINKNLLVRRINVVAMNVVNEKEAEKEKTYKQLDLFTCVDDINKKEEKENKENKLQHAMIDIKNKYGKNAILRGMNFIEGGTTIERNGQIGGHKE